MIQGWTDRMSRSVEQLYRCLIEQDVGNAQLIREVALRTKGLPVYCDMGGYLVINPKGEVFHYDPDAERIMEVFDQEWQELAIVAGSERYKELAELLPKRSADASDCTECKGAGRLMGGKVRCGKCNGHGWSRD